MGCIFNSNNPFSRRTNNDGRAKLDTQAYAARRKHISMDSKIQPQKEKNKAFISKNKY